MHGAGIANSLISCNPLCGGQLASLEWGIDLFYFARKSTISFVVAFGFSSMIQ
jgi:hypothetical protein